MAYDAHFGNNKSSFKNFFVDNFQLNSINKRFKKS